MTWHVLIVINTRGVTLSQAAAAGVDEQASTGHQRAHSAQTRSGSKMSPAARSRGRLRPHSRYRRPPGNRRCCGGMKPRARRHRPGPEGAAPSTAVAPGWPCRSRVRAPAAGARGAPPQASPDPAERERGEERRHESAANAAAGRHTGPWASGHISDPFLFLLCVLSGRDKKGIRIGHSVFDAVARIKPRTQHGCSIQKPEAFR